MEREAPLEWLFTFKPVLNMSRKLGEEQAKELKELEAKGRAPNALPSSFRPEMLQTMKQTSDRTVSAYVVADEVFETKYEIPPHAN